MSHILFEAGDNNDLGLQNDGHIECHNILEVSRYFLSFVVVFVNMWYSKTPPALYKHMSRPDDINISSKVKLTEVNIEKTPILLL